MKEVIRFGFTLAFICIIAAGLLAGVNSLTKAKIIAQAQAEEELSLKEVFPHATSFLAIKSASDLIYYQALDKEKKSIGAVFKAVAKGYSSTIEVMVGMRKDGAITTIKILKQNETPGLGTRVSEPAFSDQFKNKKDLNDIQAITGATISSRAVIDSVRKRAEEIKEVMQNAG